VNKGGKGNDLGFGVEQHFLSKKCFRVLKKVETNFGYKGINKLSAPTPSANIGSGGQMKGGINVGGIYIILVTMPLWLDACLDLIEFILRRSSV